MEKFNFTDILNNFGKTLMKNIEISPYNVSEDIRSPYKMGPKDSESQKRWFSDSGQRLLSHFMGQISTVCGCLTQPFNHQSKTPEFLRPTSPGESERDIFSFPAVVSSKETDMATPYRSNNSISQPSGLWPSGYQPSRPKFSKMSIFPNQYIRNIPSLHCTLTSNLQPKYGYPPLKSFCSYNAPQMYHNFKLWYINPGIFQLHGKNSNNSNSYNPRKHHQMIYRGDKRERLQDAPLTFSCQEDEVKQKPFVSNSSYVPFTKTMMTLDIASDIDMHDDARVDLMSLNVDSTLSHDSGVCTRPVLHDYVITDTSLVTDLRSPVYSAQEKCDNNTRQHNVPVTRSDINDIRCIVLTPKTTCIAGNKKKKSRPSSKTRNRKKLRSFPDGQITNLPKKNTNQRKKSFNGREHSDSLSFVIDLSESESETSAGSPITANFSLFVRAGGLLHDDFTDSDESPDSDFFDEDTPLTNGTKTCNIFPEFNCLSPFKFKITCITSPVSSVDDDDQGDCPEMTAMRQKVKEANDKWIQSYGEHHTRVYTLPPTKVHFPCEESSLQTVFVLSADEIDAYHEARVGKWEEFARDGERFKKRIKDVEQAIGFCLKPTHRYTVYNRIYKT